MRELLEQERQIRERSHMDTKRQRMVENEIKRLICLKLKTAMWRNEVEERGNKNQKDEIRKSF